MADALEKMRGARILRFGIFEMDIVNAEVRKRGLRVRLQEMPLQVLAMLLDRPGELIRRDDFYARLWPNDALGILDDNLNTAIRKLRVALGDSARNPRFIETVPRRGYRFIAPVGTGSESPALAAAADRRAGTGGPHGRSAAEHPASSSATSVFVGRESEMEELRRALRDCRTGRRYLAIVAGEAGIGKTRIAEKLSDEAEALGTQVLWGRSLEERGGQPYWPWVQVLRALIQSAGDDVLREDMGARAGDIATIVPELSARLGATPSETLANAEQNRFRLFDSITEYLRCAARRRPLLLIFDNLHWAGRPSLLLLEFVTQNLVDSPILLLGTYRGSEVSRHHPLFDTLGTLNRESRFLRVQLRGLTLGAVADLLKLASGASWPGALARALHRQTEGNPFFVTEVARLLIEEHALPSRPETTGARRDLVVRIPEGIREVICKRLDHLSGPCNAMLNQAAVVGREFDLDVLRPLLPDTDEDALMQALEEALAASVVEEAQPGMDRYRFSHGLIKETLYDEISPVHRARRHACVGAVLERLHLDDPGPYLSQLAHHFFRAACCGHAGQAAAYCGRAAERAESLLAYEEAVSFYQMALEALAQEEPVDEPRQCRVLLAAARAMSNAGHVSEALDFAQRGAQCARRLGETEGLVAACRIIDYIVSYVGVAGDQAVSLIHEALAGLGEEDSATRAALLGALTRACYATGMPRQGKTAMRESLAMARRVGDPNALLSALRAQLFVRHPPEDADRRLEAAREMLHVAERLGDRALQREACEMCFYDLIETGEVAEADECLLRAGQLGRAIRQPFLAHNDLIYGTMRTILQGRYDEGEKLARQALAAGLRIRRDSAEGIFGMQMFTIRRDQGRLGELSGALIAFTREHPADTTWRPGLALMYSELGLAGQARAELDDLARDDFAVIPRDVLWPTCLAYLIEVTDFVGDRRRAEQLYELMRPYGGRAVVVGACVACLGASSHYLGMLARCLELPDRAVAHFEDALAFNERLGARPWLARTQHRFGRMLAESGSSTDLLRARGLLGASLAGARELGMAALEQQIRDAQASLH